MISAYSTELGATEFYYYLLYPLGFQILSLLFSAKLPWLYLVRRCWEEEKILLSECDPAENGFIFAKQLINSIKLHNDLQRSERFNKKPCTQMSGAF